MIDGQTIGQWLRWDFEANGDLEIRDKDGRTIYLEDSDGYWEKREFDSQGNRIFYEDSCGEFIDKRPPEKIIEHNGRKYQLIP